MTWPTTHVRTSTIHIPVVGSEWVRKVDGVIVTVMSANIGGMSYQWDVGDGHGFGAGATSYFLANHRPLEESTA